MKKLTALLLALVMVLAMNVNAFAVTLGNDGKANGTDTTLTIKKEIAFFAPDTTEINHPAISYTYTIAPATDAAGTITDSGNHTSTVKVGVMDGVVMDDTDDQAVFAAGSVTASTTGALKEDSFAVSVNLAKFSSAGIYRYQLTEACDNDMVKLGYVEATGADNEKRYLDVYIGNGASGLEVKGYVLFYNASGDKTIDSTDETFKTEGFVHEGGDSDYTNDAYVDKYSAYNVTITKEVTGTMGDKNNPFPFSVEITGAPVDSTIVINVDGAHANSADSALVALNSGAVAMDEIATLKHGQSVTIEGIPVGAKVSIKEKNNTTDTYTLTTTGLDTAVSGSVTGGADSGVGDVKSDVVATKDVKFTNHLDDVSLTGVTLRFAPFAIMLGAGVALFIILKVRKNKAVEEA